MPRGACCSGDVASQNERPATPWVVIAAITLGVLLAAGVATAGILGWQAEDQQRQAAEAAQRARREGPLALPPIPAPQAASRECAAVLEALPQQLVVGGVSVPRRPLAAPVPPATVAWGDAEHDPITVRCGMDAPTELTPASQLTDISGVSWFAITEGGVSSWLAVDRPVYVAVTSPEGSGTGPVQDVSAVLTRTLPKQPVFR